MSLRRFLAESSFFLLCSAAPVFAQTRTVAITIDDLPFVSGNESRPMHVMDAEWAAASNHKLLAGLTRHHVPVIGLVNEKGVEELGLDVGTKVLQEWIQSGFDLGNHTYSHPDFDDLTAAQFEDEIVRGEKTFLPLMKVASRQSKFFRFPFNHTGDTKEKHNAVAAFLAQRGYRTAPCTMRMKTGCSIGPTFSLTRGTTRRLLRRCGQSILPMPRLRSTTFPR